MKKLVYQPISFFDDLKPGSFINERGAVRKILQHIEEGGVKKIIVSCFLWETELQDEKGNMIIQRLIDSPEFKKPHYKWLLKDFTQFGTKRITFVEDGLS